MKIVAEFSFKSGAETIKKKYPHLLTEIQQVVTAIDADHFRTKRSKEKTMRGARLYSPRNLNKAIKTEFIALGWQSQRVKCDYSTEHYISGYAPPKLGKGQFREMDFVKEKLGIEVQFGKYSFIVYNVCAKMTIFHNLGFINAGVEIVPVQAMAKQMSSGVSYFEQFEWDLRMRGDSNIDIPVLILGVAP
jgi:hypothetical protein